jgi:hypothetical protein
MRRLFIAAPILAAATLALPAAGRAATEKDLRATASAAGASRIHLILPIGGIEVRGDGGAEVRAELRVVCKHHDACEDRMADVFLDSSRQGDRLTLEVRGYPSLWRGENMEVRGVIHVPAETPLAVDMRIGDLRVNDIGADLRVDMGIGDVRVNAPAERTGRVRLGAGVGDASLRGPAGKIEGRRSLLVGAKLEWEEGRGTSRVDIDLGVGDVSVRLD